MVIKDKTLHWEGMAAGLLSEGEKCPLNNCLSILTATDMRLSPIGIIARDGGHSGQWHCNQTLNRKRLIVRAVLRRLTADH